MDIHQAKSNFLPTILHGILTLYDPEQFHVNSDRKKANLFDYYLPTPIFY